jgi:peptide/nickel transport system substrate-binding protein
MLESRRTLLKSSAAVLALAALPYRNALAQSTRDSVIFALRNEPPTLDPTRQPSIAVSELTLLNIFEGLVRVQENGQIAPCLAQSWERKSPTEYVFRLRQGVKFHDGSTFTAKDVQFTFARNADSTSTNKRKRVFVNVQSVQTPDDYTAVVTLKKPSWLFLSYLTEFTASIVSAKTADANATHPVGTGPYRLVNWVKGDSVSMEKFDGHWNAKNIAISKVKARFIADANAQVNAMLSGGLDFIPTFEALDQLDSFRKDSRFKVTVGNSTDVHILCINNKSKLFSDVRLRKAVSHAIDRRSIIDGAANGFASPIGSQMTPLYKPYYVDLTGESNYDPVLAKKLLAEAGYPNGIDTSIKVPSTIVYQSAAEIMQATFAQAGIRLKIEVIEWAQWLDVVFRQKAYDLSIVTQPDPWSIFNYTDPNYFYQYDSKEFDSLAAQADAADSEAAFAAAIQGAQRRLAQDAASGWLMSLSQVTVSNKNLSGLWSDAPNKIDEIAALRWHA